MDKLESKDFIFYRSPADGQIKVRVALIDDTIWSTYKGMSVIFNTSRQNIEKHVKNIFASGELIKESVCNQKLHTANDDKTYKITVFSLDMIIAVGYRVNSYEATQFRIWATKILKEYMTKGFVLDDERLKQGNELFGEDYFSELLDRIREIRASERMFYQKITDLYRDTSIDYDKDSEHTRTFYKKIQNKLIYAVTEKTAPEVIKSRANAKKDNMGLNTWKTQKDGGKIIISDIIISKNYLYEHEIKELNRIVSMLLDYTENLVSRSMTFTMSDWVKQIDDFLEFNRYEALQSAGSVAKKIAIDKAKKEFNKFRIKQDKEFVSDFDKVAKEIIETGSMQISNIDSLLRNVSEQDSSHNKALKKALEFNPKSSNRKP